MEKYSGEEHIRKATSPDTSYHCSLDAAWSFWLLVKVKMETIGKQKNRWFLKAELVVLVCLICIWVVTSITIDIDSAKGEYDRTISDHTKVFEIDPRDVYKETDKVSYVPEQQQVVIDQQPLQILQGQLQESEQFLETQYNNELNSLKQQLLTDQQFHNKLCQLNAKYQEMLNTGRYKMKQQVQQIKQIQNLINDNKISIQAGNEAVWRLVLPRETKAMFPTQEIFHPIAPGTRKRIK